MGIDSYGNYGRRFDTGVVLGMPDPMDDDSDSHGTHVAGTIGAVGNNNIGVVGVNWGVKMLAVKVLDSNGYGTNSNIIRGINYVISEKNNGLNIRVANMSFGGYLYSAALDSAIYSLSNAGIICVMAAGNDSANLNIGALTHYPSNHKYDNTIAVGSFSGGYGKSSFSNYGNLWVDIAAPGSGIFSTKRGNGYRYMGGTSMSTPHVAGAAAILCAAYPSLSASDIKARLMIGANKNYGVSQGYWNQGVLDVWTALILPMIHTKFLPVGVIGTSYNQSIIASSIAPLTWQITGSSLPTGLSLNSSTGVISGTPTTAGLFYFVVTATNSGGTDFVNLGIIIYVAAPTITTSSLPGGTVGIAYSQALSATGATPITWAQYGGYIPDGLILNSSSGIIYGTPTTSGTFNFTVGAQNSGGSTLKAFSISISSTMGGMGAPTIITSSLPMGWLYGAYEETLSATGLTPITWSIDSGYLPEGRSLNATTGVIYGEPVPYYDEDTFYFTIRATNSAGTTTKNFSIYIWQWSPN
jgi:subtilisin family serine protease